MNKKVGDKVARIFYAIDNKVSVEDFYVVEITDKTVIIDEFGRKKDGTYGPREYSKSDGWCIDDPHRDYKHPKMTGPRRKINFNI